MCELPERNFVVTLASADDGTQYQFRLTSPCVCDINEWVAENAALFPISSPRVLHIDDKAAYHMPLADPKVSAST